MKKLIVLIGMVLMLMSVVVAVDMVITPELVHMDYTDSKDIEVCVYRADGSPYVGLDLYITSECQDLNGNEACDAGEVGNAVGIFDASVKTSPTDIDGCGEVTLTTTSAPGGTFAYSVNSQDGATVVDEEGGLAYIPEMGVIGAMLVLGGAGLFIARKRQ